MIAILFIIAAGYFLIVGAGNLAERALKIAAGLALILAVLPGLIASIGSELPSLGGQGLGEVSGFASSAVLFLLLAGVGAAFWKARGFFAKRRETAARRWGSPRDRAVPPPPEDGNEGEVR